jgi:basic membrane protein A and related proteins
VAPRATTLGLAEGRVDPAMNENNAKQVMPERGARVDAAQAQIIAGKLKVSDYTLANRCR